MLIKINRREQYKICLEKPEYPKTPTKFKNYLQNVIDGTWNKFISWNPFLRDIIKLNAEDTWNVDYTLSKLAVPLLVQLQRTKHGYGFIKNEDVPDELKDDEHENDERKYDWFMNELIWCLNEIVEDKNSPEPPECADIFSSKTKTSEEKKQMETWLKNHRDYDARIENGCRLFGKYFKTLWD